jgi:hypothetical protein
MSADAMRAKFAECAAHARLKLQPGRTDAMIDRISRLETLNNAADLLT